MHPGALSFRGLYSPIQPSASAKDGIYYQEYLPDTLLDNLVYCYWQLKTVEPLSTPYTYRVVSDGCVDIFFDGSAPKESFVMGFSRQYIQFDIGTDFNYFGIRFFPSTFTQLFGIDAQKLSHQENFLYLLLPDLADAIKDSCRESSQHNIELLSQLLLNQLQTKGPKTDPRFDGALYQILRQHGHLDINRDLNIGISPRQLRRLFNYYIGTTPKSFAQVVRFQYVLSHSPTLKDLREKKIYFDAGFYDQAHFIKEFKKFYGLTPAIAYG